MNKRNPNTSSKTYCPPAWLTEVLQTSRGLAPPYVPVKATEQVPDHFRQRCQEAAEVALTLAKLRRERQRIGFMPLSFSEYIQGIAGAIGVSLSPVLARLGIADLSRPDAASAGAFARLGQEIGFSLRETLALLRIGFVSRFESTSMLLLVAHRRSGGSRRSQLEECEEVLRQVESECDPKALLEFRRIESEVRTLYEAHYNTSV